MMVVEVVFPRPSSWLSRGAGGRGRDGGRGGVSAAVELAGARALRGGVVMAVEVVFPGLTRGRWEENS
ncbi:hypothetical protein OV079_47445 [Nannocystis pusilla]|uniref:Uncharacterized protein n=1 Tax=Nannocystis pusilla TaxID=889268 RepID=A0A9X3J3B2_9BACT|nr:hypothetical protein [Nannocystis pusilla]MCY1013045.1 hypothetical protein [Nannocystis pusilla]